VGNRGEGALFGPKLGGRKRNPAVVSVIGSGAQRTHHQRGSLFFFFFFCEGERHMGREGRS